MSFWRRLLGKGTSSTLRPQRLDYLNEALALERQGDFEAALTSYRLALRGIDQPLDARFEALARAVYGPLQALLRDERE